MLVFIASSEGLEQAVHGRGLAGIGVANQGDFRQVTLVAAGRLDFFLTGDFFQFMLDGGDLLTDGPPVHFQFGFSGPAVGKAPASRTAAATLLIEVVFRRVQAGQLVLEAR